AEPCPLPVRGPAGDGERRRRVIGYRADASRDDGSSKAAGNDRPLACWPAVDRAAMIFGVRTAFAAKFFGGTELRRLFKDEGPWCGGGTRIRSRSPSLASSRQFPGSYVRSELILEVPRCPMPAVAFTRGGPCAQIRWWR